MKKVIICGILCLLVTLGYGATRRVPSSYSTISAAMSACAEGDTILVAAGTYNEKVTFSVNKVKLISESGATVTTINGGGGVTISSSYSGMDVSTLIQGFTITGGTGGMDGEGGGLRMWGQNITVRNCIFTGNAANEGAGLYLEKSDAIVESCLIYNNNSSPKKDGAKWSDGTGGGVYTFADFGGPYNPTIRHNTIINNHAGGSGNMSNGGGGVAIIKTGAVIQGNYIANNTALYGTGGIAVNSMSSSYTITISNNRIETNDDIGLEFRQVNAASVTVNNNHIEGHTQFGLRFDYFTSGTIDATNNWWGDASGPYHATLNPSGLGNGVKDTLKSGTQSVDFDPWLNDTSISVEELEKTKEPPYILSRSWPNPFLYNTSVKLESRFWTIVSAVVYDVTGKEVKTIMMNAPKQAGTHLISWDGRDASGKRAAPGMYFLRTKINNSSRTSKIVLLK